MATDEERRKVAQKLRKYASWDEDGELVGCTEFGESVLNLLSCGDTERECFNALADLIEPPTQCPHYHSERHYCSVHEDLLEINRDSLLKLADELQFEQPIGQPTVRLRESCWMRWMAQPTGCVRC